MIDRLAKAIQDKDWDGVIAFHATLTGTNAANIEVLPKNFTKQVTRVQEDFSMKRVVAPKPAPPKAAKAAKKGRPKKAKAGVTNKFDEQAVNLKVDALEGADKINDNIPLTPRTRKPFKMVDQECIICHETISVHPTLKKDPEAFKCDSCLMKPKNRRDE